MNTGVFEPDVILLWGCNWRSQYERDWLLDLLRPSLIDEYDWYETQSTIKLHKGTKVFLIESAIHLLSQKKNPKEIKMLIKKRSQRIKALSSIKDLTIIHLSDEEGLDGSFLYKEVNPSIKIIRNFYYEKYNKYKNIYNLPLGPTRISLSNLKWINALDRKYIWNFIGTTWKDSEREGAISTFRSNLPNRHYIFTGEKFSQGIKQEEYIKILSDSIFTLCPEGHRHFETFRFYEALETGSIPLIVNAKELIQNIYLSDRPPIKNFNSWSEAALFVKNLIKEPNNINKIQNQLREWWQNSKYKFSSAIKQKIL